MTSALRGFRLHRGFGRHRLRLGACALQQHLAGAGHGAAVYCVAFRPDGTMLASGGVDKTVRLWNTADGKEVKVLSGHPDDVYSVCFSPDGKKLASIGYGEIVDLSTHPMGRLFTVGIAAIGILTLSYLFSSFVALLLESDLNTALRKKRMKKEIAKLTGHYIVCGIGRVGSNVAEELIQTHRSLVVIENSREVLNQWLEQHPNALHLHADAADDEALRSDQAVLTSEHPIVTDHNGIRTVIAKKMVIRDEGGKPQYLLTVVDDVTEVVPSPKTV